MRAWLQKPEFNEEVNRLIEGARKRILAKLTTTVSPKAAAVIESTLDEKADGPPSHSEQLRAAELALKSSGILGHGGPAGGPHTPQVAIIVVQHDEIIESRKIVARLAAAERRWAENGGVGTKPSLDDVLDAEVIDSEADEIVEEERGSVGPRTVADAADAPDPGYLTLQQTAAETPPPDDSGASRT